MVHISHLRGHTRQRSIRNPSVHLYLRKAEWRCLPQFCFVSIWIFWPEWFLHLWAKTFVEEFSRPELVSFKLFSPVCYPAQGRFGHWYLWRFHGVRQPFNHFVSKYGSALLHIPPLKYLLAEIIYRNGSYFGRVSNNLSIKINTSPSQ